MEDRRGNRVPQLQVWIDKAEVRWRTNQKRQFTVYFRIYTSGAIAIMFIGQNERARKQEAPWY
jgi:hypothetical protein